MSESLIFKILNKSFELCPEQVTEKIKVFIIDNKLDIEFISYYPDKINSFRFTITEIRELWKSEFSKMVIINICLIFFCINPK
jgi:hypothetical protein